MYLSENITRFGHIPLWVLPPPRLPQLRPRPCSPTCRCWDENMCEWCSVTCQADVSPTAAALCSSQSDSPVSADVSPPVTHWTSGLDQWTRSEKQLHFCVLYSVSCDSFFFFFYTQRLWILSIFKWTVDGSIHVWCLLTFQCHHSVLRNSTATLRWC